MEKEVLLHFGPVLYMYMCKLIKRLSRKQFIIKSMIVNKLLTETAFVKVRYGSKSYPII